MAAICACPQNDCTEDSEHVISSLCISELQFESALRAAASSNDKMRELNHDLDAVLARLHAARPRNITVDEAYVQQWPAIPQSLCISEQKFDSDLRAVASSNDKMRELNHDLDAVLDRLHAALARNITVDGV
ncbi:unnamed protein product [Plutella xylostella]|uniref:(diamondback moth) hypothetical protein n=1 Tax=Plutella xylostella TaxID=51655 RepID=A0A8S4G110_PLUXY|nr:unnamed protein product [Plutella xylostella]